MPIVSVVIPCYNQVEYVGEAIASVLTQTFDSYEVVVVDDGSTDPTAHTTLDGYASARVKVIHTENQRLASARNNGIRASTGEYILPLDADDKIASTYLEQAVRMLDADTNLGIVYCEAEFFGDKTGKWDLQEYRFPNILLGNMINSAGMYRRADWETVKGYNPNMWGLDDYDFWLSLIELGRGVYRIPETLFFYRQRSGSKNKSYTRSQVVELKTQLFRNHPSLYSNNVSYIFEHMLELQEQADYFRSQTVELKNKLALPEKNVS